MFSKNILLVSALIILAVFVAIFVIVVILDIKKAKRLQQKYTWKRTLTALLFLLPACILAYFFVLLPIIYSLKTSQFHRLVPDAMRRNSIRLYATLKT